MNKSQHKPSEFHLLPAAIKQIIFKCDDFRDRCIIKTLAYTAMRREELQLLDIPDLDFERSRIHIRSGKGGKSRIVPVAQSCMADLKHLVGDRQKGPMFMSQKGGRISKTHINRIVAKAGAKAGITNPNPRLKYINPHIFRHSFTRNALKANVPYEKVQKILGHASIRTTIDIYGEPSLDDTQDDYEQKIEGMYG